MEISNENKNSLSQTPKILFGIQTAVINNNKLTDQIIENIDWPNCLESKKTIYIVNTDREDIKIEKTYTYTCKVLLLSIEANLCCLLSDKSVLLTYLNFDIKKPQRSKTIKIKCSEYNGIKLINNSIVLYLNNEVVNICQIPKT